MNFAVISFLISLVVGLAFWLFPDTGKHIIENVASEPRPSLQVPGHDEIEKQINLAKMQGVGTSDPSSEFAVAVPFVRPSMELTASTSNSPANVVALTNASPLRSTNQDLVFAPGKCRFLGSIRWLHQPTMKGEAAITVLSCILDNGDTYGFGESEGPEIGFVASLDQPASRELQLTEEDKSVTLPTAAKYIVRFSAPLHDLPFKGKGKSW